MNTREELERRAESLRHASLAYIDERRKFLKRKAEVDLERAEFVLNLKTNDPKIVVAIMDANCEVKFAEEEKKLAEMEHEYRRLEVERDHAEKLLRIAEVLANLEIATAQQK